MNNRIVFMNDRIGRRFFRYFALLAFFAVNLIGSSCWSDSTYEAKSENVVNQPSSSSGINADMHQDKSIKSSPVVNKNIADFARKAGLIPLKEKKFGALEMELRLWGNIGLDVEKVLVIHMLAKNKGTAILTTLKHADKAYKRDRRNLLPPKSGWEDLGSFLRQNRVAAPLPFSFDSTELLSSVDEGSVFLEINQGGQYDFIYYGQSTESVDGKAVINICRKIEDEFQVNMGCSVRTIQ